MEEDSAISDRPRYVLRSSNGHCELPEGETLAGRSRNCRLVVEDPSVSRSHALFKVRGDLVFLQDLSSSNGTFVNGQQVEGETRLAAGDKVTLGEAHFSFGFLDGRDEYSFADVLAEAERADAMADLSEPVKETVQSPVKSIPPPASGPPPTVSLERIPGLEPQAGSSSAPPSLATSPKPPPNKDLETGPIIIEEDLLERDVSAKKAPEEEKPLVGDDTLQEALRSLELDLEPDLDRALDAALPEPFLEPPLAAPEASPPLAPIADPVAALAPIADPVAALAPIADLAPAPVPSEGASPSILPEVPDSSGELLPSLDDLEEFVKDSPLPMLEEEPPPGLPSEVGSLPSRPAQGEVQPAGLGARAAAGFLDGLLAMFFATAASLIAGGPWRPEGGAIFYTVSFGLQLLLQVFGWHLWGTTPGKRLFSLYVFEQGSTSPGISTGRALLRFAGYCASVLSLGLGFLMIVFNPGRRGLHDVISGTYVGRRSST